MVKHGDFTMTPSLIEPSLIQYGQTRRLHDDAFITAVATITDAWCQTGQRLVEYKTSVFPFP
jgi:hypothetical protein